MTIDAFNFFWGAFVLYKNAQEIVSVLKEKETFLTIIHYTTVFDRLYF